VWLKSNHSFDDATIAFEPEREGIVEISEIGAVGDPGSGLDLAVLHIGDDALEIGANGIAAAEKGKFAAMKIRIVKGHIALEEANEDKFAALAHKLEGSLHRLFIASGIKDHARQIVSGEKIEGIAFVEEAGRLGPELLAKGEPGFTDIDNRNIGIHKESELSYSETDGACANDQNLFAGYNLGS